MEIQMAPTGRIQNRDTRLYASIMHPNGPWSHLKGFGANHLFTWGKGGNNTSKIGYNYKKKWQTITH